ncbi:hypothetical protein LTR53_017701, partial [Teratosphaeriaceae sp. CCFEE 6253]
LVIKREESPPIKSERDDSPQPTDSEAEHDRHDAESSTAVGKKSKEQPEAAIPLDFVGTVTGNGTSREKPNNAVLDEPWPCGNRNCSSGMTWHPRSAQNGKEGLGRKTISDYFGRNKRETRYIDDDVWHIYCRKCYQRKSYKADKLPGKRFSWHLTNIKIQFRRLKLWRPDALFNVRLSKNMLARSDEWHRMLRAHHNDKEAAQLEYDGHERWGAKELKDNKKNKQEPPKVKDERAFPIELVDQFVQDCCGSDFDYDRIDETIASIESLREAGTLTQMPPIEFLIHAPEEGEAMTSAATNYERWAAQCDDKPFDTPAFDEERDEDVKVEQSDDDDSTRDALIDAVDQSVGESDDEIDVKEESDAETVLSSSEEAEVVSSSHAFTPFIPTSTKAKFQLTAAVPNPQRLSSTFGSVKGSGMKRKREDVDHDEGVEAVKISKRE